MKIKKDIKIIKELDINPVRDYLEQHKHLKLSTSSIANSLNLKRNKVNFFAKNSNHIRQIQPHEVGCYKYNINVFTYQ